MNLESRTPKQKNLIVWDFDGVICDSTFECLVTSSNAWDRIQSVDRFRTKLDEFSKYEIRNFQIVRNRVAAAGEYFVIHKARKEEITISNQEEYDFLVSKYAKYLVVYRNAFFECRSILKANNIEEWFLLHKAFPDIISLLKEYCRKDILYIASMKDKPSVCMLLKYFGVNIDPDKVLDSSRFVSKLEALKYIAATNDLNYRDICIVDDNIKHLLKPKEDGFGVYLSAWCNPILEYTDIAKSMGIDILKTTGEALNILGC